MAVLTKALEFDYPKFELEFYLTLLQFIADANKNNYKVADRARIFNLYARIETRYQESVTPGLSREMIAYV
jgi:hypothetical protein